MADAMLETGSQSPMSRISPQKIRVAGVIVTYNRLKLLQRLVTALRQQTRQLDKIFIINNGSTDGTAEWVQSQNDLQLVTQGNLGGAGGQATGIRLAYDEGFDWVWCMDDDGLATPNALEKLMPYAERHEADWLNSLVIDQENVSRLSFGLIEEGSDKIITSISKAKSIGPILQGANPFNGTLLSRVLIEKIGVPHAELFIWGDEQEYHRRAEKANARILTVVDSLYYHPASSSTNLSLITLRGFYKYYYHVRNYMAETNQEGKLQLAPKAARQRGLKLIKSLMVDTITIPVKNILKIGIILHGIWAAHRKDLRRRYF